MVDLHKISNIKSTYLKLTADEMITTKSRVLIWEPSLSVDSDDPLHFPLRVGWNSEKSLVGTLACSICAAQRTASVRHLDGKGDKTQ